MFVFQTMQVQIPITKSTEELFNGLKSNLNSMYTPNSRNDAIAELTTLSQRAKAVGLSDMATKFTSYARQLNDTDNKGSVIKTAVFDGIFSLQSQLLGAEKNTGAKENTQSVTSIKKTVHLGIFSLDKDFSATLTKDYKATSEQIDAAFRNAYYVAVIGPGKLKEQKIEGKELSPVPTARAEIKKAYESMADKNQKSEFLQNLTKMFVVLGDGNSYALIGGTEEQKNNVKSWAKTLYNEEYAKMFTAKEVRETAVTKVLSLEDVAKSSRDKIDVTPAGTEFLTIMGSSRKFNYDGKDYIITSLAFNSIENKNLIEEARNNPNGDSKATVKFKIGDKGEEITFSGTVSNAILKSYFDAMFNFKEMPLLYARETQILDYLFVANQEKLPKAEEKSQPIAAQVQESSATEMALNLANAKESSATAKGQSTAVQEPLIFAPRPLESTVKDLLALDPFAQPNISEITPKLQSASIEDVKMEIDALIKTMNSLHSSAPYQFFDNQEKYDSALLQLVSAYKMKGGTEYLKLIKINGKSVQNYSTEILLAKVGNDMGNVENSKISEYNAFLGKLFMKSDGAKEFIFPAANLKDPEKFAKNLQAALPAVAEVTYDQAAGLVKVKTGNDIVTVEPIMPEEEMLKILTATKEE